MLRFDWFWDVSDLVLHSGIAHWGGCFSRTCETCVWKITHVSIIACDQFWSRDNGTSNITRFRFCRSFLGKESFLTFNRKLRPDPRVPGIAPWGCKDPLMWQWGGGGMAVFSAGPGFGVFGGVVCVPFSSRCSRNRCKVNSIWLFKIVMQCGQKIVLKLCTERSNLLFTILPNVLPC